MDHNLVRHTADNDAGQSVTVPQTAPLDLNVPLVEGKALDNPAPPPVPVLQQEIPRRGALKRIGGGLWAATKLGAGAAAVGGVVEGGILGYKEITKPHLFPIALLDMDAAGNLFLSHRLLRDGDATSIDDVKNRNDLSATELRSDGAESLVVNPRFFLRAKDDPTVDSDGINLKGAKEVVLNHMPQQIYLPVQLLQDVSACNLRIEDGKLVMHLTSQPNRVEHKERLPDSPPPPPPPEETTVEKLEDMVGMHTPPAPPPPQQPRYKITETTEVATANISIFGASRDHLPVIHFYDAKKNGLPAFALKPEELKARLEEGGANGFDLVRGSKEPKEAGSPAVKVTYGDDRLAAALDAAGRDQQPEASSDVQVEATTGYEGLNESEAATLRMVTRFQQLQRGRDAQALER